MKKKTILDKIEEVSARPRRRADVEYNRERNDQALPGLTEPGLAANDGCIRLSG